MPRWMLSITTWSGLIGHYGILCRTSWCKRRLELDGSTRACALKHLYLFWFWPFSLWRDSKYLYEFDLREKIMCRREMTIRVAVRLTCGLVHAWYLKFWQNLSQKIIKIFQMLPSAFTANNIEEMHICPLASKFWIVEYIFSLTW